MNNLSTGTLIGIVIVLSIIGALLLAFAQNRQQGQLLSITNFDECAAAGYPIMESYPERCRTPDGRTFVNERQITSNDPITFNGCAVAGCFRHLLFSYPQTA